jgi:hypothetical protein
MVLQRLTVLAVTLTEDREAGVPETHLGAGQANFAPYHMDVMRSLRSWSLCDFRAHFANHVTFYELVM